MTDSKFVFLFIAIAVSLVIAEKNSSEINNSSEEQILIMTDDKPESDSESKTKEKDVKNFQNRQRRPNHSEIPNQRRTSTSKLHEVLRSKYSDEGPAIPHLGFSPDPRQNIYLSDYTGEYDVMLQNFQSDRPTKFQGALGAIPTHLLDQRNNKEYVPYPPNGDLCNYSAYSGNPRAAELLPAVGAYERAGKTNYGFQSSADFGQRNPSRFLFFEDYRGTLPNLFQNFYSDSNSFNRGLLQPHLKSSDRFYEYK